MISPTAAKEVRATQSDRIIGSKMVRRWKQDVDCFLRDVPARLRFTSCQVDAFLELRCILAWCDRHIPEKRGAHSYSLQMKDWRFLGYGSRLEWLTDGERAKLCRALTLRLETRHGVPVLCVHPSEIGLAHSRHVVRFTS